jgi:molecular chaperone GrpE
MPHDHTNHAPEKDAQAPEAELPQAPGGRDPVPEGHDGSRAHGQRPQGDTELEAQPGAPRPQADAPDRDEGRAGMGSPCDLEELAAKAQKADEYLALAQRTQADFENYRRRTARDAVTAQERGATKLALALLPAIDNLDRALAHADEVVTADGGNGAESLVAGLKHVHADLISALGNVGIERYSPEGEPFDPQYHEAVAQQPVEGAQPGVVVEVFQRGYRMGENVVRPARVVVAG